MDLQVIDRGMFRLEGYGVKRVEEELERFRSVLYQYVDGVPSRLANPETLPISMLLDDLIINVQKRKMKKD